MVDNKLGSGEVYFLKDMERIKNMDEAESKNEKPKEGLRFSQEQYDFLIQCSKDGEEGIKKWNEWRKTNKEDICLEGAKFHNSYLNGALLDENPVKYSGKVYLRGAVFRCAHLVGTRFMRAHLEDTCFYHSDMQDAHLMLTHLEGAEFSRSVLKGAQLSFCTVDGTTIFLYCKINRDTWFDGVGLDSLRIEPQTKVLLEYNIRRIKWERWYQWEDWYEGCPEMERSRTWKALCWPIRAFWEISDYGISTKRIIKTFFKLAFVFAIIYYIWGFIDYYLVGIKDYPGIVSDLFVLEDNQEAVSCWLVPFRAVYFSIVTMTTLGFGDMYANAHSFLRGLFGHLLLALQVILGYVLLGALVTRFAVLFTAGGPAGKFADEKGEKDETE